MRFKARGIRNRKFRMPLLCGCPHFTGGGGFVECRQSCLSYARCFDCTKARRAVANHEINSDLLKAGMRAISHLRSKRRFKTARVEKRAVATDEIDHNQLKAGMMAISHHRSKRRFETARVLWRAVANNEINFNRLKARMMAFSHFRSKRRFKTAQVE